MVKRMMTKGAAGSCSRPCAELAGRLPVPGEEFVQLVALGPTGDDAHQHISQIGLRIEFLELCRIDQRRENCQLSAPPSLPLTNELRRPIAIGRIERSTLLESTSTRPSRRNSVSPCQ
jgi:hypothetical protein